MRVAAMALGVAGAVFATPLPGAQARVRIPHFTAYYYAAKISVKGGAHQDASYPTGGASGTVVDEHAQGSFSIDDTFPSVVLVASGRIPGGNPSGSTGTKAVVNGTWTNQGNTWDDAAKTKVPYTCAGTIGQQYAAAPQMRWSLSGSAMRFNAHVLNDPLTVLGQQSCPGNAFYLSEVDTPAYSTTFSIPRRSLGRKTIVVAVSGPLGKYRPPVNECRYSAGGTCAFNTAWQGVIRLTRVRTLKL